MPIKQVTKAQIARHSRGGKATIREVPEYRDMIGKILAGLKPNECFEMTVGNPPEGLKHPNSCLAANLRTFCTSQNLNIKIRTHGNDANGDAKLVTVEPA